MKVLIVDDNQVNLLLLKTLTTKIEGCKPYEFQVPAEALRWCEAHIPDMVLLDYMMPEMNGIEFLKQFRTLENCRDVPVIIVTADHEIGVRYEGLQAGANDFLTKPVDKTEFMARAKNMLELRRSHNQLADRALQLADEVRKATHAIVERERDAIFCLSRAAEYRDPETGAHIVRMAHFSRHIAKNLGLSQADQDLILEAAPMHDIGKVGIPDNVLLKPGKLDDAEFALMKQHALIGYQILKVSQSNLLKTAAAIAYTHHEKFDGNGYPRRLAGEEIPIFGRIVAVADVFDALTSVRPYKQAWEVERAIELIRNESGKHFDPACVEAFLTDWDEVLKIKATFVDEDQ
jgi:putative two-component system response regulator